MTELAVVEQKMCLVRMFTVQPWVETVLSVFGICGVFTESGIRNARQPGEVLGEKGEYLGRGIGSGWGSHEDDPNFTGMLNIEHIRPF